MPQSSRYSDEKVEGLLSDLVSVLEKNHTESFANALLSSVKEDQSH